VEHPVHAARVEVIAAGTMVRATALVYTEDFPPGAQLEAVGRYLARTLRVVDAQQREVVLTPYQISTEGDRLRITLRGTAVQGLRGGRVVATLLHERFDDQVNVVEARVDGRRRTLVFLSGDAAQRLP
jgi:hypothetical protein